MVQHSNNLPISTLCLVLLSIVIICLFFSLCLALLSVGGRVEDQPPPVDVVNPKCKNNYVSVDCGAKVIRHNLEAKVQLPPDNLHSTHNIHMNTFHPWDFNFWIPL